MRALPEVVVHVVVTKDEMDRHEKLVNRALYANDQLTPDEVDEIKAFFKSAETAVTDYMQQVQANLNNSMNGTTNAQVKNVPGNVPQ